MRSYIINTFKVGDLVIMQNANYFHEYDGCLGIVERELHKGAPLNLHTWV